MLGDCRADRRADAEDEKNIGIRIAGQKAEPAISVRMGRDQPELQPGNPAQELRPHQVAP
ncbi:hypothetical protein D3C71_1757760 [compost metagenome]